MTLNEALEQAQVRNGELAAAAAREQQAHFQAEGAGRLPNPEIGIAALGGNGAGLLNSNYINLQRDDYYVYFNQSTGPWGTVGSKKRSAQHRWEAARQQVLDQKVQLQQSVKDEFFRLLAAQQRLEVNRHNLELAEQVVRIAQVRHKVGQVARLDLMSAEVERNRAGQELVTAESELRQSRARLAPLLGLAAGQGDLNAEGVLEPPALDLALEQLQSQVEANPKVAAADANLRQAREETLLASQQGNPSAGINLMQDLVIPNYVLQLTLSVPIDYGELGFAVAARRAAENEAEAQLRQVRVKLLSELQVAYDSYRSAQQNQRDYRQQVLDPAEEMAKITEKGYRKGALPYAQLLISQRLVSDLRRQFLDKQLEAQLALNALEAALGRPLERP